MIQPQLQHNNNNITSFSSSFLPNKKHLVIERGCGKGKADPDERGLSQMKRNQKQVNWKMKN